MIKFFAAVFTVLTIASTANAGSTTFERDGMVCKKVTTFETIDGEQVVHTKTICESK